MQMQIPFLLHAILELPPSVFFLLSPSAQFTTPQTLAHPIIRQYAVLLFTSVIIALIFAFDITHSSGLKSGNDMSGSVAAALAVYHLAPITRATSRLANGEKWFGGGLGGPIVHLITHVVVGGGLVRFWWEGK